MADEDSFRGAKGAEVQIDQDDDHMFDEGTRTPFVCMDVLGNGYSAVVQKVQHRTTKEIFARKTIKFPRGKRGLGAEERFQNETDIIRHLRSHRHIIELFATYRTKREGCLLLQPAADEGNLQDYLESYGDFRDESMAQHPKAIKMTMVLEQAFGCLATGLSYMHEHGIRHKDIKPQNILIHRGTVVYTDFGASKNTTKDGECTTEGLPDFLTRKYSPPEVLDHDKRNYAADVYSLGCVFIEILSALNHLIYQEEDQEQGFSNIMNKVHLKLLSGDILPKYSFLPHLIICMTLRGPEKRHKSKVMAKEICRHDGFSCSSCRQAPRRFRSRKSRKWHGFLDASELLRPRYDRLIADMFQNSEVSSSES